MLEEFAYYLGCQCSRPARRLGYAYEMAALQARHRRCQHHWQPHLHATRQSLLVAAASIQARGDAIIIGAGSLQDIPLIELLDYFEHIYLLDMVFTWATRRIAKRYPDRIHCCFFDTTGIIDEIAQFPQRPIPTADTRWPPWPVAPVWIASVNVLQQLPLLPRQWLQRHGASSEALETFSAALIEAHLQQLMACDVPVCLITEVETRRYDQQRQVIAVTDYRASLIAVQGNANCLSQWLWAINPIGELTNGEQEISTVEAWQL